jgi:hypothetical protein
MDRWFGGRTRHMADTETKPRYLFPRWVNYALPAIAVVLLGGAVYVPVLFALGASPKALAVGYSPVQPVPYSHKVHAGQLRMDCRYCHFTVDKAAFAAIPPTQVCMNCHSSIRTTDPRLQPIRDSWATGQPVNWIKIHDLPDYVYFNHSAHVNHGVGCETCHGRIDEMDQVRQAKPLSMAWCLECHRNPEKFIRPLDKVTTMGYQPDGDQIAIGEELKNLYKIHDTAYMQSCSTCHR